MGCDVYANGDEIACKAGAGKVIAAFPDVCLTPPPPPAGPIPVPYPDTSFSRDMQNGSKTVQIKGQEVMLKDSSFYKSSPLGNEAATNGQGAGVTTHVITGKTYFVAWSMDVKFEDQNVDRHTDMTTSNHASPMANVVIVTPNTSAAAAGQIESAICECCKQPLHPSQKGGKVISEEEFYGVRPQDKPTSGDPRALARYADRQKKFRNAKRLQKQGCKALPEPDCNVYRVVTSEQVAHARAVFDEAKPAYQRKHKVGLKRKAEGGGRKTINHRVPLAAGGCPTAEGNLVPDNEMTGACINAANDLDSIQGQCADNARAAAKGQHELPHVGNGFDIEAQDHARQGDQCGGQPRNEHIMFLGGEFD